MTYEGKVDSVQNPKHSKLEILWTLYLVSMMTDHRINTLHGLSARYCEKQGNHTVIFSQHASCR